MKEEHFPSVCFYVMVWIRNCFTRVRFKNWHWIGTFDLIHSLFIALLALLWYHYLLWIPKWAVLNACQLSIGRRALEWRVERPLISLKYRWTQFIEFKHPWKIQWQLSNHCGLNFIIVMFDIFLEKGQNYSLKL